MKSGVARMNEESGVEGLYRWARNRPGGSIGDAPMREAARTKTGPADLEVERRGLVDMGRL